MRPLILLAILTPSARACFDETRGGCFTAGFVDNLSSADCAKYGKTLCGSSDSARCQGSGCYYNSIYQWTNEPCEPGDEGYECTTP